MGVAAQGEVLGDDEQEQLVAVHPWGTVGIV